MEISSEQANKVAYFIFENLEEYINSHYKEFQQYLEKEKKKKIKKQTKKG